jgi:hypothetical protein
MKSMFRSAFRPFCIALACLSLIAGTFGLRAQDDDSHHGRKYKAPPPSATISVTVVRAYNGKPIGDAHVIFHPIEGDRDKGALELKTNEDGKATIDVIPMATPSLFKSSPTVSRPMGRSFKIDKSNMTMDVRLKRPVSQYSVYKNSTPDSGAGGSSGSGNNSRATNQELEIHPARRRVPRPPIPGANLRALPAGNPIRLRVEVNRSPRQSEPRPDSLTPANTANSLCH